MFRSALGMMRRAAWAMDIRPGQELRQPYENKHHISVQHETSYSSQERSTILSASRSKCIWVGLLQRKNDASDEFASRRTVPQRTSACMHLRDRISAKLAPEIYRVKPCARSTRMQRQRRDEANIPVTPPPSCARAAAPAALRST